VINDKDRNMFKAKSGMNPRPMAVVSSTCPQEEQLTEPPLRRLKVGT
jgi:hypothetical protein